MSEEQINVLVIDDDEALIDMVRMGLEADRMRVLEAHDGAEGIEVLSHERVDVIVLDIMMPNVDGWMALMQIRSSPATADTPVIVLSGKTEDLAKILAFKQGVQQYVTKPFNILELSARVESLARGSRRKRELQTASESDFRKLAVRKGGRTVLLAVDEIVFLSARHKSTYAHTFENQYIVDATLGELEGKLAKESFVRIHRSYMANLNRIKEILRMEGGYLVVVADRDETRLPVARRQVKHFRDSVGI